VGANEIVTEEGDVLATREFTLGSAAAPSEG
jgi:hypothetical protein